MKCSLAIVCFVAKIALNVNMQVNGHVMYYEGNIFFMTLRRLNRSHGYNDLDRRRLFPTHFKDPHQQFPLETVVLKLVPFG